jgi:hypothetical protein
MFHDVFKIFPQSIHVQYMVLFSCFYSTCKIFHGLLWVVHVLYVGWSMMYFLLFPHYPKDVLLCILCRLPSIHRFWWYNLIIPIMWSWYVTLGATIWVCMLSVGPTSNTQNGPVRLVLGWACTLSVGPADSYGFFCEWAASECQIID